MAKTIGPFSYECGPCTISVVWNEDAKIDPGTCVVEQDIQAGGTPDDFSTHLNESLNITVTGNQTKNGNAGNENLTLTFTHPPDHATGSFPPDGSTFERGGGKIRIVWSDT